MGAFSRIAGAWFIAVLTMGVSFCLYKMEPVSILHFLDGLQGIGLIIGGPMIIFCIPAGIVLTMTVSNSVPLWSSLIICSCSCAFMAWIIAELTFTAGWEGASQVLTAFAFFFGLSWAALGYFVERRERLGF